MNNISLSPSSDSDWRSFASGSAVSDGVQRILGSALILRDRDHQAKPELWTYLKSCGYELELKAKEGADLGELGDRYDTIILDMEATQPMELDLIRDIRRRSDAPIILLAPPMDDLDRILALELGADDFLQKPFNPRELAARIKRLLTRTSRLNLAQSVRLEILHAGGLEIRPRSRELLYRNQAVDFTSAEFDILMVLAKNAGQVVPKARLCEEGLNRKLNAYDRSVDVHISRIRKKLSKAGAPDSTIVTRRNAGYCLAEPVNTCD